MIPWPTQLPIPVKQGFTIEPQSVVIRTDMEGKTRVRRRFSKNMTQFKAEFRLTPEQFEIFKAFYVYKAKEVEWISMPLYVGEMIQTEPVRFMNYMAKQNNRYWLVSATLESEDLTMMSETELDSLIGV